MRRLGLVLVLQLLAGCSAGDFLFLYDDGDAGESDVDQVDADAGEVQPEAAGDTTPQVDATWADTSGDVAGDSGAPADTATPIDTAGDVAGDSSIDTSSDTGAPADSAPETKGDADAGDAPTCRKESELCMGFGPCCSGLTCSPIVGLGCVK